MNWNECEEALGKGEFAPLYYLYGDEPYLIERVTKTLLERVVAPDFRDFNQNIFYGGECRGEEIVASAQTLPMFADRRVVVIRRGTELPVGAIDLLDEYGRDPSPSTCLVLHGEKRELKRKGFPGTKGKWLLVECRRPYENQLGRFVREEAARLGKRIEPAAVELVTWSVGTSLQELAAQLEKAATFVGEREVITRADVREIVSASRVETIFELTDAVGARDIGRALRSLATILQDGGAPLMVLGGLSRHFRQLLLLRELLDQRRTEEQIGREAGISPFLLKKLVPQAKRHHQAELRSAFARLHRTDVALKSSPVKPPQLLEVLIRDLCGSK